MNIFRRIGAWLRTYVFVIMDVPPMSKKSIMLLIITMGLYGISYATIEYYSIDIPRLWMFSGYVIVMIIYLGISIRLDWDFYKQGIRMKQLVCQLILCMFIFAFVILCINTRQKYLR